MRRSVVCWIVTLAVVTAGAALAQAEVTEDAIGPAVQSYFDQRFSDLKGVAEKIPTTETFREAMKPVAESTDGFFGGTLIDTDYVIRQVYFKKNFLARGFDLKKVEQLEDFWDMMTEAPAPQLSEPGHGSLVQPRLIAMRYPVIVDGQLQNVVSMMIRTEYFLEATGLDKCAAYRIICRGEPAEEKGELSESYHEVKLELPSTEWVIQYDL